MRSVKYLDNFPIVISPGSLLMERVHCMVSLVGLEATPRSDVVAYWDIVFAGHHPHL